MEKKEPKPVKKLTLEEMSERERNLLKIKKPESHSIFRFRKG